MFFIYDQRLLLVDDFIAQRRGVVYSHRGERGVDFFKWFLITRLVHYRVSHLLERFVPEGTHATRALLSLGPQQFFAMITIAALAKSAFKVRAIFLDSEIRRSARVCYFSGVHCFLRRKNAAARFREFSRLKMPWIFKCDLCDSIRRTSTRCTICKDEICTVCSKKCRRCKEDICDHCYGYESCDGRCTGCMEIENCVICKHEFYVTHFDEDPLCNECDNYVCSACCTICPKCEARTCFACDHTECRE